jgi:prevent-host-death family protein
MRKITATELQRHARDVIDQVRMNREPVVVENRGKPMAAVLPYEEYEQWQRYRAQRERDFRRLREFIQANAALNQGLSEDEVMELADQLIREEREEQRRKVSA